MVKWTQSQQAMKGRGAVVAQLSSREEVYIL